MSQSPLLFCGNSNPQLAEEIAKRLRIHVGKALVSEFRNEETRVEIGENVRGSEAFVVQSICRTATGKGVNDAVMELLLMIDALRRASAARITAVIPYYGYAKQDNERPRADLRQGDRQRTQSGRRSADRHDGLARGADPRLLRHSRRQSDGRTGALQFPQEGRALRR